MKTLIVSVVDVLKTRGFRRYVAKRPGYSMFDKIFFVESEIFKIGRLCPK